MKFLRPSLQSILRLDWAIYLLLVGGLLCAFGGELAKANESQIDPPQASESLSLPLAGISLGAIYSLVVLVVIPLTAFVVVNVRASRNFRARVSGEATVPTVEAKIPTVSAKQAADTSSVL